MAHSSVGRLEYVTPGTRRICATSLVPTQNLPPRCAPRGGEIQSRRKERGAGRREGGILSLKKVLHLQKGHLGRHELPVRNKPNPSTALSLLGRRRVDRTPMLAPGRPGTAISRSQAEQCRRGRASRHLPPARAAGPLGSASFPQVSHPLDAFGNRSVRLSHRPAPSSQPSVPPGGGDSLPRLSPRPRPHPAPDHGVLDKLSQPLR